MSIVLMPKPASRVITKPHSKMRRLFQEASARRSTLVTFDSIAKELDVVKSTVNGMFGSGKDVDGSVPPDKHLGAIVAAFNREGVPLRLDWFYQPFEVFCALLDEARGSGPAIAFWRDIVWRHACTHPALSYHRPATRGFLRRAGAQSRRRPEQLHIGEWVHIRFDPPGELACGSPTLHLILVAESGGQPECLFPLQPRETAITPGRLLLPSLAEGPFEVEGPPGLQYVHAVLTRFVPSAPVHTELEDLDLRAALDVLASELASHPPGEWAIYQSAAEVIAP